MTIVCLAFLLIVELCAEGLLIVHTQTAFDYFGSFDFLLENIFIEDLGSSLMASAALLNRASCTKMLMDIAAVSMGEHDLSFAVGARKHVYIGH